MAQYRIRTFQLKGWQVFLIATLALALLATLFVVAVGAFLILFPIFILVGAIAYLFGIFRGPRAPGRDGRGPTIETDYRVIEQDRLERDPPPGAPGPRRGRPPPPQDTD